MKKTNQANHKQFAALTLAALGVVYGDIGTSPLYALKEVFGGAHNPVPISPDNILGILSLFFWSLMIVVTLKYVTFIMRANNEGEGGIVALMTLATDRDDNKSLLNIFLVILGLIGAAFLRGRRYHPSNFRAIRRRRIGVNYTCFQAIYCSNFIGNYCWTVYFSTKRYS
jgi:K+ transporter